MLKVLDNIFIRAINDFSPFLSESKRHSKINNGREKHCIKIEAQRQQEIRKHQIQRRQETETTGKQNK